MQWDNSKTTGWVDENSVVAKVWDNSTIVRQEVGWTRTVWWGTSTPVQKVRHQYTSTKVQKYNSQTVDNRVVGEREVDKEETVARNLETQPVGSSLSSTLKRLLCSSG